MGSHTYAKPDWNGLDVWSHLGYPQKFDYYAELPYMESPFPVNDAWEPGFFETGHGYAIRKSTY